MIEDENMGIGKVRLMQGLFDKMQRSPVINLISHRKSRAKNLVSEYSGNDDELIGAVCRIERRLGTVRMKKILEAVSDKDYFAAAMMLLEYYDKTYQTDISKRPAKTIFDIDINDKEPETIISELMLLTDKIFKLFYSIKPSKEIH
jgi:hypothetical protein